jgi:hypothetical protein
MSLADVFYLSATIGIWGGLLFLAFIAYRVYWITAKIHDKIDSIEQKISSAKSGLLGTGFALLTTFMGLRRRRGGDRYE